MKNTIILMFLFLLQAKGQDTIVFKNGDVKVVKLTEISANEVKYKQIENLEGPTYIIDKLELQLIRFSSGHTDSLVTKSIPKNVPANVPVTVNPATNMKRLDIRKKDVYYMGGSVGIIELKDLIDEYPHPVNKEIMLMRYANLKKYSVGQGLCTGLIPIGFLIPAITSVWAVGESFNGSSGDYVGTIFVSGVVVGAACRISGFGFSKMFKNKKLREKMDIAALYNEMK